VEADPTTEDLDRIEAAVDDGTTDLRALGFWTLLGRIKRDRVLIDRHADQAGRIDAKVFHVRVKRRLPVWAGTLLLLTGIAVGALAVVLAFDSGTAWVKGLALILATGIWSLCVHGPAHYLTGRLLDMRFTDYFLGGPPPPRPGLKTELSSYLRVDPASRAWFHASGAIATKLAPFVALAFWPGSGAPWWAAVALAALGVLQIVTDLTLSVKSSDWKRFLRERAVARSFEPPPPPPEPYVYSTEEPTGSSGDRAERPAGDEDHASATLRT
jgi:hypothetical protein